MHYDDKIELRKIQTEDGLRIGNKVAVVDSNTNRVLGIVSPRYKLIHNTDLLKSVLPAVEELKLNGKPPTISVTKGGSVTFFKFLGDKLIGEIQKGDIVRFGVEFFNSYDGSMPVGFHIIAERLVCTNGLVVPKSITEIHIRHIGDASSAEVRDRLKDYAPKVQAAMNLWKSWNEIHPKEELIKHFLKQSVGKRLAQEFEHRYKSLPTPKQTLWEFYNILTFHISHQIKTRKEEIKALRQFNTNETLTNRLARIFSDKEVSDAITN